MSVTILYRHPARADEAGMRVVPDDAYADALNELVRRGFQIVKIAPTPTAAASRAESLRSDQPI